MALPFFFDEQLTGTTSFNLNEETSKHVIQVLRMRPASQIKITNGKGQVLTVEIVATDKKATNVKLLSSDNYPPPGDKKTIGLSLLKNEHRFEWFVEKATELGVTEIIPLICERTEKQHFRLQRLNKILVSAMLQSQRAWLPLLREPLKFEEVVLHAYSNKFIAHCSDTGRKSLQSAINKTGDKIILIGPEGDFTREEINVSKANDFMEVSLGNTRLRSETAGVVAAVLMQ